MSRKFRLAAAAVSAVALTSMTLAPAAFAEDTAASGSFDKTAPISLIDDNATSTLHITKYLGGFTDQTNDGRPIGGASAGDPLADVTFTIWPVTDADLTTNEGWTKANSYYNAGTKPTALGEPQLCTTDANGQCDLSGLKVGLYYVEETAAPDGVTKSKPFFVTLPMTNPAGPDGTLGNEDDRTSWMYDVYVYPKNQKDTITKEVVDKGTVTTEDGVVYGTAGQHKVDYVIKSSITDGNTEVNPLNKYVVYDQLAPEVQFEKATVALSNGTALEADTDYTLTVGAADSATPGLVTITMTEAGLLKLEAARNATAGEPAEEVKVVTTISVSLLAEVDGVVPNKATFIPNKSWEDQMNEPIPSNEVISKYGDLKITKVDPKTSETLAGAEFVVYADGTNDEECTAADVVDANKILGPVATNEEGTLLIKGLQASDWYDNAVQEDLLTYCLVETKAPAGYNLQADPMKFTIGQSTTTELAVTEMTVNNEKQNLNNELPLTGGQGTALLSLAGLMLVAGGAGYYFVSNRRREEAQN